MVLVLVCCLLAQAAASDLERGLEAYSRDDLPTAEAYLQRAVRRNPRQFRARFLLGATLVRMNRGAAAIAQLQAAHRLEPHNADVVKLLAIQLMNANRHLDALPLLAAFPPPLRDEELYLLLIEAHQTAGSVDRAGQLVREGLQKYPRSAPLNAWMGFEMKEAGRFAEARQYLERALRIDPAQEAALFLMGDVLMREEKYQEALPWLRKALDAHPDDVEAAIDWSRAKAGSGDLAGAVAELERASRISPQSAKLALELSRLYARQGERDKARRQAEIAARLRQNESAVPTSLLHSAR